MNGNTELLNYIYQNAQMGVDTLGQLLTIVKDEPFKKQLQTQREGYLQFYHEAKEQLHHYGHDEKQIHAFDKLKTYLMINMQTLTDKSVSHITEMLMIGSNMGIINAIKNLKKYSDAKEEEKNLMSRLLSFEENNVQQLKQYLS